MNMREYQAEDLEAVMAIANAGWKEIRKMSRAALGDRMADMMNPAGDDKSKGLQVKDQIDSGLYNIDICEHDGEIVGFITYKHDGFIGEICNNAAKTGTGLKGIGQMMYKFVLEKFRSENVKIAKVTTGMDYAHAPARKAYERAGFSKHLDSTTYFMELD